MPMWNEADVRNELEDVREAIKACRADGDLGYEVYWMGYEGALESVNNESWDDDKVRLEIKQARKTIRQCREIGDIVGAVRWSGYKKALEVVLNAGEWE